jgi:hypothetical protein
MHSIRQAPHGISHTDKQCCKRVEPAYLDSEWERVVDDNFDVWNVEPARAHISGDQHWLAAVLEVLNRLR